MNGLISFLVVFLAVSARAEVANTKTSLRYEKPLVNEDPKLSFILPSFVVHGFEPAKGAAHAMPRKLIANGDAVITPGFGLEMVAQSGLLVMSAIVKDCYDNLAGTLQIGKDFRISRDSHVALSGGFYFRQTPLNCEASVNPNGGCTLQDEISAHFIKKMGNQWIDVIPMPFIHYSYSFYRDKDWEVKGKIIANFLINEIGLEIPF